MRHRQHIPYLLVLACVSLFCACKSPSRPSVSEPQALCRITVAHDGYAKDESGVWHAAVVLENPAEVPIEYIIGSYPTGELPEGSRSTPAVGLSEEDLRIHLRWNPGEPQMPMRMMTRYGLVRTKVLAPQRSERILLPLYVTPSHPGKTHTQLLIGIRPGSGADSPQTYESYIAELVL